MLTARFTSMPLEPSPHITLHNVELVQIGLILSTNGMQPLIHAICNDKFQHMNTKEVQLQELQWRIS